VRGDVRYRRAAWSIDSCGRTWCFASTVVIQLAQQFFGIFDGIEIVEESQELLSQFVNCFRAVAIIVLPLEILKNRICSLQIVAVPQLKNGNKWVKQVGMSSVGKTRHT
jgi:hypothetical protein